jgi:hypothetical protein
MFEEWYKIVKIEKNKTPAEKWADHDHVTPPRVNTEPQGDI